MFLFIFGVMTHLFPILIRADKTDMKFDLKYRGTAFMWIIFVFPENSSQLSLFRKYKGQNHSGGQGTDGNMVFKRVLKI
jgi:hypothetical protein